MFDADTETNAEPRRPALEPSAARSDAPGPASSLETRARITAAQVREILERPIVPKKRNGFVLRRVQFAPAVDAALVNAKLASRSLPDPSFDDEQRTAEPNLWQRRQQRVQRSTAGTAASSSSTARLDETWPPLSQCRLLSEVYSIEHTATERGVEALDLSSPCAADELDGADKHDGSEPLLCLNTILKADSAATGLPVPFNSPSWYTLPPE